MHGRADAFELWCWRRLLRVPQTGSLNQSILKEINPEYPLERHAEAEAPILWAPDAKNWLTGKDPDAGKDWRQEETGTTEDEMWMASPTQWTWAWASYGRWWRTGKPDMLHSRGPKELDMTWATEQQNIEMLRN